MRVSSLTIIESLSLKLLEFPELVDSLKRKDFTFLDTLEHWLKDTEIILKKHNLHAYSTISAYRSKIIAPSFAENQQRSVKKRQLQVASELLFDIQQTIIAVLQPHENKVNEAKDLLTQVLSVIRESGTIKYTANTVFQDFVTNIWHLCSVNDQLKPFTVKICSLISQQDALRIIAAEIQLTEWM